MIDEAVEETNAEAAPTVTETSNEREDDLDKLLAEFDEGTKTEPKAEPDARPEQKPDDLDKLRRFAEDYEARELQREILDTVHQIKEKHEALGLLSDGFLEARLQYEASRDPRLAKAWVDRHQNPDAWGKVLDGLGSKLSGEISSRPDPQLTQDRETVRNAVRGVSTAPAAADAPKNDDLSKMNDAEFEEYKKKLAKAG